MAGIFNVDLNLGGIVESIRKHFADKNFTEEERADIDLALRKAETSLGEKELAMKQALAESEARIYEAQSAVVSAEAKGESWLQRNWRPLLMVVFAFLLVCTWFGLFSSRIGPDLQMELLNLVKWGMSGYIVGRSAEKIAGKVSGK